MFQTFLLAFVIALVACGDSDNVVILEDEPSAPAQSATADTTDVEAAGATSSSRRSDAECRERAEELVAGEYEVLQTALDQTFAFRGQTGDACFIPLYRDVTAAQLQPGEAFPYPYAFVIDEQGDTRDLEVMEMPAASAIEAVGFEDINDDGVEDIFIVNDGDAASLAFVSDLEFNPEGVWSQMFVDNAEAGIFVETVDELKDFWRENESE